VPPCDIGELIKNNEAWIRKGIIGKSISRDETATQVSDQPLSIFDISNYPPPWPLIPFFAQTPKLKKQILFHLLPKKLVVHNP
jgi:hypothetical protein